MTIQQPDNPTTIDSADWQGENLIFLISQPRAGSTMLQRMLSGHPDIHTLAEPWVMLHPCYGLKNKQCLAEYEAGGWASRAVRVFLDQIGGENVYYEGLRKMGCVLYSAALRGTGKTRFLDKTPRYYYIIDELSRTFPKARFVILLRNPLAMLSSLLRTWIERHWLDLPWFRDDLLRAPRALIDGIAKLGERALVVRYEDLVQRPDETLVRLCVFLDVVSQEGLAGYGREGAETFAFGDTTGVVTYGQPVSKLADRWVEDLRRPWMWRFAHDYLAFLTENNAVLPGYDLQELVDVLHASRPTLVRRIMTVPFSVLMKGAGALRRLRILFQA
jgi:hypothetical protein